MDLKDILLGEVNEIIDVYKGYLSELNAKNVIGFLRKQDEDFDKAVNVIEKVISASQNISDTDSKTLSIKAATVCILSLWNKMGKKGSAEKLNDDDWKDIAQSVLDYAVIMDPKTYTKLVFVQYRKSIEFALEKMAENAEEDSAKRLEEIIKQLKENEDKLDKGAMTEVAFVDDDLWLCLEAIFIVLSDRTGIRIKGGKYQELSNVLGAVIFQKIRLGIYEEELQALEDCLNGQKELDEALTKKLNDYIMQLKDELDLFDKTIEEAFSSDFKTAFTGSAKLAAMTGAEEVLESMDDIDNYFL